MILIADSGSTKTDWVLADNGTEKLRVMTQGINPVHTCVEDVEKVISGELLPHIGGTAVDRVFFYGAGCRGDVLPVIRGALSRVFGIDADRVFVASDLLAAARALCGSDAGVACILGTGSNSCLYDGGVITANVPPLGYILGDEGSGAVLGRMFLNAIFKDTALASMRDDYLQWSGLDYAAIINKVYRQPLANRFLASTSLYISAHIDNPVLRDMVKDNFRGFFRNNISRYHRQDLPVNAIGSIAHAYRSLFAETAMEEGYAVGRIMKSPMPGLLEFHSLNF